MLLILATVTISALSGENGILSNATRAKKNTEKESARERIQIEVLGSYGADGKIDVEVLKENITKNIAGATVTGENLPLIVTVDNYSYEIGENGSVELTGPRPQVSEQKIVASSDGTGEEVEENSQENGTELYISFKTNIEGGTIKSVTCSNGTPKLTGELWVTKVTANGTYKFTIVGTVDGEDWSTTYTVSVEQYAIRPGLDVGDYINYEPDSTSATTYSKDNLTEAYTGSSDNTADITQDTLNWQILKIYEDGSMDLIGSPTTQTVYFKGARGYNNGVYAMDDICKTLYSREGIEARSVDLEDFESNLTEAGKKAKSDFISNRVSSLTTGDYITNVDTEKNEVTYVKSRSYYPILYGLELENGISMSDKYYTKDTLITEDGLNVSYKQAETLTVPYVHYCIFTNSTNYGDTYKALTASNVFWVASRAANGDSDSAMFWLCYASSFILGARMFDTSNVDQGSQGYRLRPVVSLGSGVQVTPCSGTNGTSNTHTITQY